MRVHIPRRSDVIFAPLPFQTLLTSGEGFGVGFVQGAKMQSREQILLEVERWRVKLCKTIRFLVGLQTMSLRRNLPVKAVGMTKGMPDGILAGADIFPVS